MTSTSIPLGAGLALAMGVTAGAQAQEPPSLNIFGRIYLDHVQQETDPQSGAAFDAQDDRIRTARIGADGKLAKAWSYKAEVSTTDEGGTQWEDLYVEYRPIASTAITAGNFKTVGLENLSSSRYTMFMEKGAFTDALDIGRVMHVRVRTVGDGWTAALAVSGDSINESDPLEALGGEGSAVGVSARATYAPINHEAATLHLGVWGRLREREDDGVFNYRTRNNSNFGPRYTATGGIGEGDRMLGLEGLFIRGPGALQAEWAGARVDRRAGGDEDFTTYYVAGSWYVTGERRAYNAKKGELDRTEVLRPVTEGGLGALELAVRYDNLDLEGVSTAPMAGEYSAWTAGASWWLTSHARLMANYTRAENDSPVAGADVDVDTLQFRFQYDF